MQEYTAFDMDAYMAGTSKKWQFWNCEPSSFPFAYGKVEHLYMLVPARDAWHVCVDVRNSL